MTPRQSFAGVYFVAVDHQGTGIAVVREVPTGNAAYGRADIDASASGRLLTDGRPVVSPNAQNFATAAHHGFTGQAWDADAGLYNDRARWYDPQSERLVSTDPARLEAGDANLYCYVGDDPQDATGPRRGF